MQKILPMLTAIGLVATWAMLLVSTPSVLSLFADFRIEASPLTIALIWFYNLFRGLALPLAVLATALLVGFQKRLGWLFALVLCLACDLAFLGLLLPVVSLVNILGGDGEAPTLSPSASTIPPFESSIKLGWGMALALASLILNQAVFVLLLVKRRDFER